MTVGRIPSVEGGIQPTLLTAKGDLISATAASTVARLAVGSDAQILVADSTASTGLKWATPTPGALTFIKRSTFTSVATTTTTFDDVFTSTYRSYMIIVENFGCSTGGASMYFQFRYAGPTTQNVSYYGGNLAGGTTGSPVTGAGNANASLLKLNNENNSDGTRGNINVQGVGNGNQKGTINYQITDMYGGLTFNGGGWNNASDRNYTGFILSASAGNITGTVAIYGLATS